MNAIAPVATPANTSAPQPPGARLGPLPCPFCSLLCDDVVVVQGAEGSLTVVANGCARASAGFAAPLTPGPARLRGRRATLEAAVERAAAILGEARQPHFGGLATDVAGMRAIMALCERTGGTLDHMHGEALAANVKTLQTSGWMTTTLAEVRNRADLLVFAGTDAISDHPRFFERVVWNRESLFDLDTGARELVYLGSGLDIKPGIRPDGRRPLHFKFDRLQMAEVVLALRALLAGQRLQARAVAGVRVDRLAALIEQMQKARYGVLVWSAAQLDPPHSDLAVDAMVDLVKELNTHTRFAGLPLGGNDGGITANSVSTWQSGFPLRTGFGPGYPEHDSLRYSTAKLIAGGGADVLVWISAYREIPPPETGAIPVIALGRPGVQLAREPEVFIPVGTPGVDHAARVLRCDAVVSLRVRELRASGLASVAQVMDAIAEAL